MPGWHDYLWDLYPAMKKDLTTEHSFLTYFVWAGIACWSNYQPGHGGNEIGNLGSKPSNQPFCMLIERSENGN